ncbi:2OG-Fe(II) oxygenase [Pedobacter boryungensis]|uniref:2OG-Fe(II) oxygenase n=1 Tax=Pedobacter boryungensis TaxID=869962 RepID=A0ABX2DE13_9SPHI|nr:2OG-Fe(II) oxygenase [Pedobacter boryungensis]NQX31794.1 2OG-Fe(II) oxygenase [Pedobacter boryungensis]
MTYLNKNINLKEIAKEKHEEYVKAWPFPNIVIDDFFDEDFLTKVLHEFPDLSIKKNINVFDNVNEKKLGAKGESDFGANTKLLCHYLNSQPVLEFLQELTGIKEVLLPDPYFYGGGYHEIKPGGYLKIHADFNKHNTTNLDRRINLLVYLNKDWEESYGGFFELWDESMESAQRKLLPIFNRVAIFSTTDFSYHGHPDPLTCPPNRSRKSIALYYYTNGRPAIELNDDGHSTLFVGRKGKLNDVAPPKMLVPKLVSAVKNITPPIIFNLLKRLIK